MVGLLVTFFALRSQSIIVGPHFPAPKPNIVFVLADDLGYGDLESYGQKTIRTPCTSELAADGMRFTQFYSGSTVCAPSRDCLMTGRDTGHAWMRGNGSICLRPDPEDITFATVLKKAGYDTAMIGKSSVQCDSHDPMMANEKGFDTFFGQITHTDAHFHFPTKLYRNGEPVLYPDNQGKTGVEFDHDLFLHEALNFIDKPRKKPFLLYYAATLPHAGMAVPERWKAPYVGRFKETPFKGGHYNDCSDPIATYAGMVSRLDWDLGQLRAELKVKGFERNTLVIFTSDNGGAMEGGYHAVDLNSNGGLRGTKRDLYEGGIRIPFIAAWPGHIPAGRTNTHIGAFWDVMPTVAALGGGKLPSGIQGLNIEWTLLGRRGQYQHSYLYWEFHEEGGKRALRMGKWKAIQVNVNKAPGGPIEIYDLGNDVKETTNVAAAHPELVAKARRLFATARTPNPNFRFDGTVPEE